MTTNIRWLASKLACDDGDLSDDRVTVAWSELLSAAQHGARQFAGDIEREYNALAANGPDKSGRQTARIERLLSLLPAGTVSNVAGWLDDAGDDTDDLAGDDNLPDVASDGGYLDGADEWLIRDPFDDADAMQFGGLFDEDDHPRDDEGKFTDKSGGKSRASIASEAFKLTNSRRGKQRFENIRTKQKKLLEGMDALPGQQDLFEGGSHASTPPSPAPPALPVEKRSYTTFKHPEEGYIDLRRLQLRQHSDGLHLIETYKDQLHTTPVAHEAAGFAALHKRIAQLKKEGWRHHEGPSGGPMQFSTGGDTSGEHWITIGSVPGPDGKRHGGTPVKISGGKIISGPKHLRGKTLKGLAKIKPHAELRRAVKKAAREHGLDEHDLHGAIELVHGERSAHHAARESAKEAARKLTGLSAADVSRLSNAGHDYASGKKAGGVTGEKLRHFDEFARELARSHPELGLGDADSGDDHSSRLWDVLAEGKRDAPAKHHPEVIDEAVGLLNSSRPAKKSDRERYAEMQAIPFSLSAGSRPDRPGAAGRAPRPLAGTSRLPKLLEQ